MTTPPSTPFQTVLCALDFEPGSGRALVQAADLAERGHGALHLLHVAPLFYARHGHVGERRPDGFRPRIQAFVNRTLGSVDAFEVLAPEVHEVHGQSPADGVLDCARAVGADLVVVGAHGRRGLGHLIVGSVAADVVRRSPVPVWVVPEHVAAPGPERPVVVAVDLSDSTVPLLRLGGAVAQTHGTSVVPVHVRAVPPDALVEPSASVAVAHRTEPTPRLAARAAVADAVREAGVDVGEADTYVVPGVPGRSVVSVAEQARAGLIVMGTHGRTGLDRLRLGSVAEWVLRHAPCPVLTVPVPSS